MLSPSTFSLYFRGCVFVFLTTCAAEGVSLSLCSYSRVFSSLRACVSHQPNAYMRPYIKQTRGRVRARHRGRRGAVRPYVGMAIRI